MFIERSVIKLNAIHLKHYCWLWSSVSSIGLKVDEGRCYQLAG